MRIQMLLIIMLIASCSDINDESTNTDLDIVFANANFKAYLLSENIVTINENTGTWLDSGKPIDANGDGKISKTEALAIKYISCSDNGVSSLSEIEYFTNLEYLDCRYNNLTSLNVSANKSLSYLACGNNKLTTLDLSSNNLLYWLTCENNKLTALNLSANTLLKNLNCKKNSLISLDLKANRKLKYVDCENNDLIALDIRYSQALEQLYCRSNQLTTLNLTYSKIFTDEWKYGYFGNQTTLHNEIRYISITMTESQKIRFRKKTTVYEPGINIDSGITIVIE